MPLVLLPLLRFVAAILSITFVRARRPLIFMSHVVDGLLLAWLVVALTRGIPSLITIGSVPNGLGISMIGDRIGMTFASLAWGLSIAVSVFTWKDQLRPYFFLLFHLLIGACYALAFTKDLFNAYLLFELLTLVSFLLVGYQRQPRQIWASLNYLILSSLGMTVFLFGVGVVYAHCGSLDYAILVPLIANAAGEPWVLLAASLLVAGVAVKAGVFTFSLWLPSAHARAMPPVSALLSGLVIKMGVLELFRLADIFPIQLPLLVLGSITGLLGTLYAVFTYDLKKMLAFSTLAQIGYILIGFGASTWEGRLGALEYAVAHGLFKSLLFLALGEAATQLGNAQCDTLVAHKNDIPWGTRIALIIGTLGIIGLPPLAGFDAKVILEDGLASITLRIVVLLISVGTAMSFSKFIPILFAKSTCRTDLPHAMAYSWLGGLILAFWPISVAMSSWSCCIHAFTIVHIAEAVGAIAIGGAVYALFRKRTFRLPQAIFHLEISPLIILLGFVAVYVLIAVGN